jgi:hypothetical protein
MEPTVENDEMKWGLLECGTASLPRVAAPEGVQTRRGGCCTLVPALFFQTNGGGSTAERERVIRETCLLVKFSDNCGYILLSVVDILPGTEFFPVS